MRIEFEVGQRAVRFHRGMRHFVGDVAALGDVVGFGKSLVQVAEDMVIIFFEIMRTVLVDEIAFGFHRLFRIEVGWKRLVFHVDQLDRIFGNLFADCSNAGNMIAHVADLLHRQRGLVVTHRKNTVWIRRVSPGDHSDDAVQRFCPRSIDMLDSGVGIGRMENLAHQHAGKA